MLGAKALSVVTTLVLARILAPEQVGLMAAATVVIAAAALFGDAGFGAAVIASRDERQRVASTAFFLVPLVALVLYAGVALSAPGLAALMDSPDSVPLIRIAALVLVLNSLSLVPSALLEKDMRFRRKAVPELLPVVLYAVTALVLAQAFDAGAYAIAVGQVVSAASGTALYWLVAGWRPTLLFDRAVALRLAGYGKHVLGGNAVLYLTTNMDNVVVSRLGGADALGLYAIAYALANLPATHLADVVGRVLLPSYVELSEDPTRLRRGYARTVDALVLVVFPVVVGLAATSPVLVPLMLGEDWRPMVPVLAVLLVFGAARGLSGATGNLFLAVGRPEVLFITGIAGLLLQTGGFVVVVLAGGGLLAVACVVSGAAVFNGLLILGYVQGVMHFHAGRLAGAVARRCVPLVVMGLLVLAVGEVAGPSWPTLLAQVATGAIAYPVVLLATEGSGRLREALALLRRR